MTIRGGPRVKQTTDRLVAFIHELVMGKDQLLHPLSLKNLLEELFRGRRELWNLDDDIGSWAEKAAERIRGKDQRTEEQKLSDIHGNFQLLKLQAQVVNLPLSLVAELLGSDKSGKVGYRFWRVENIDIRLIPETNREPYRPGMKHRLVATVDLSWPADDMGGPL